MSTIRSHAARSMFEPSFVHARGLDSFRRLTPRAQWRNPVMFVCYIGAILTTGLFVQGLSGTAKRRPATSSPCRPGSGSRCCSPTSPRRSPRAAARRRRTRCAPRGRTSAPRSSLEPRHGASRTLVQGDAARKGRRRAGRSRRHHPARRRGHRGRRLGERDRRSPANPRR